MLQPFRRYPNRLPKHYGPVEWRSVKVHDSDEVLLPHMSVHFTVVPALPGEFTWRKPITLLDDRRLFAEVRILQDMLEAGWHDGRWLATRTSFLANQPTSNSLRKCHEPMPENLPGGGVLTDVLNRARGKFDVVVWSDDDFLFVEAKRKKRDSLKSSQLAWIRDCLGVGIAPHRLVVVEWCESPA